MSLAEVGLGVLLTASGVAALLLGGPRERAGAAMLAAVSAAFLLLTRDVEAAGAAWSMLALDTAAVALLGRMAWRARAGWPIWTLAAEAVAAAASLAFALQPDIEPPVYLRAVLAMRYVAAAALFIGACRRRRAHL